MENRKNEISAAQDKKNKIENLAIKVTETISKEAVTVEIAECALERASDIIRTRTVVNRQK